MRETKGITLIALVVTIYMSNLVNGTGGGSIGEEPELPSDGSYSEQKGVNTPNLGEGMIPIKWNGSAWKETTGDDEEWYDYLSKKWANAVVGGSFNEDGTLNQSSNYSMFVWIPRYAYSITSGYHQSGADLNSTTPEEGAGTIEVEFMKGTSNGSATGTVYGVYDMSGGSWEYVAAYVNNGNDNLTIYGSSLVNGDAKAKNVYTMGSGDTKQANYNTNASKYGDAVYETSSEYETSDSSWHADYSSFPSLSGPFFRRGGGYSNTTSAGMFFFNENTDYNGGNASFRPVLVMLYGM